jgi:hypothetical protein
MPQTYSVGARSLFVTATAWLFIALAAFASLSAVLQQAAAASLWTGPAPQGLPLLTGLLLNYLPYVMAATLALSLATLASAIGLLMRLEWARRAFIGLIVAAIVMNLTGLWLQHEVMAALVSQTLVGSALPPAVAGVFGGFVVTARVLSVMLTLVACMLLAWIIRRLMSPMVKQEFA